MLILPKIAIIDSATLGKVSHDFWSSDESVRRKAHTWLTEMQHQSIYIGFTLTHVFELIRHQDDKIVRDRLAFLHQLPYIAWVRPYDRAWFPGGIPDLLRRELHAFLHRGKRTWSEIRDDVRSELWETGVGSEMFVKDSHLWNTLRAEAIAQHQHEKYVASVARTDPGHINQTKLREAVQFERRRKDEIVPFMRQFAATMKEQLDEHGDERLSNSTDISIDFANNTLKRLAGLEKQGGDVFEGLLALRGVPIEWIHPELTIGDIGELAVYVERLTQLSGGLVPRLHVTAKEVPPNTLPAYVFERRLTSIQRKAARVSGSDFGDSHLSVLSLYADGVEVDKRTHEYLRQIRRTDPTLTELLGNVFRCSDYSIIPSHFR